MSIRRGCLYASAALLVLAVASPAAAQVRRSKYDEQGGYHEFLDDPLDAKGAATQGWVLRIRPNYQRVLLIRPRTSFVSEMLKSVEKM